MAGLGVIVLVVALGMLATVMARPARAAQARRRAVRAMPSWVREPPLRDHEAERRSLELLRSVVNPEEWEMFQELGFICITGRRGRRPGSPPDSPPRYRYLIYPHLPVVALLPRSMAPVREYCVQFPDRTGMPGGPLLPVGDDVLAKWMTLRADEDRLLSYANVGGAGCQVPLSTVERDLERLERWRRRRQEAQKGSSVEAPAASAGGGPSAVSSSIRF
ncbi:MAG: hypothetical protein AB7O78_15885 [Thermoleophilia bacterium]